MICNYFLAALATLATLATGLRRRGCGPTGFTGSKSEFGNRHMLSKPNALRLTRGLTVCGATDLDVLNDSVMTTPLLPMGGKHQYDDQR